MGLPRSAVRGNCPMKRLIPGVVVFLLALAGIVNTVAATPQTLATLKVGTSKPLSIAQGEDGLVAFDLSPATPDGAYTLTIRRRSSDATALVSRAGVASGSKINFTLVQSDTASLAPGIYVYDGWQTDAGGNQRQVIKPTSITIRESVRRSGDVATSPVPIPVTLLGAPGLAGVDGYLLTEHPVGRISWQPAPVSFPPQNGHAGQVLLTDGTTAAWTVLTLDMIGSGFTITSFALSGQPSTVEVGSTVTNPAFTAAYNRPPAAVTLNDGSGAQTLTLPATAFSKTATYTLTTVNASKSFTLSANESGGPVKTASVGITWAPRVYWGSATPATYTAAFVTALGSNALATGRQRTIALTVTAGKKFYYAVPASFGGASSNFIDQATGFAVGVSLVGTVTVTNSFGIAISYNIFASNQQALGALTVVVN